MKRYYWLQSSWHFGPVSSGIRLTSPLLQTSVDIETSAPEAIVRILDICRDGFVSRDPIKYISFLLGMPEGATGQVIDELSQRSILLSKTVSPHKEETPDRYSRQVKFFKMFEDSDRSGSALDRKLRSSSIAVVGVGGYGCWIAMLCARIGIRRITLIDHDTIEESNLSRQVLFSDADVGKKKVAVAASSLASINPNINCVPIDQYVDSSELLARLLEGVDLVFNPYGYAHPHANGLAARISRGALLAKVPCLVSGGSWIGPLTVANTTPCYRCLFDNPMMSEIFSEVSAATKIGTQAAFAPRLGINCSVAVWEACRFLAGIASDLLGSVISLDTIGYSASSKFEVARSDHCAWCSGPQSSQDFGRRKLP